MKPVLLSSAYFQRISAAAVFLPFLLVSLAAAALFTQGTRVLAGYESIAQSDRVVNQAVNVEKLFIDMETSLRGYLISGRTEILAPYFQAESQIEEEALALKNLVQANPAQAARVEDLAIKYARWIEYSQRLRLAQETHQKYDAYLAITDGKRQMEAIRQVFRQIVREEGTVRERQALMAESLAKEFTLLGLALAILVATVLALYFRRQLLTVFEYYCGELDVSRKRQREIEGLAEQRALLLENERVMRLSSEANAKELRGEQALRERFVASLSHDLRTPLTVAQLSSQLLLKEDDLTPATIKIGRKVLDSLKRADRMISDLLDVSRLRSGQPFYLDFEPCTADAPCRQAVEELASIHGERFRISPETGPEVVWNIEAVRRIVENLLSNAVKYGDPERPITVSWTRPAETDEIQLTVHNYGNPIPLSEQSTIFDHMHRRANEQSRIVQGWGIGLSLVKGMVEAHGGSVAVFSTEREGTRFVATLPRDARGASTLPGLRIKSGGANGETKQGLGY